LEIGPNDGTKIFLESHPRDDKSEPKAFEEIDRVKNLIDVSFTKVDEKDFIYKIFIDRRKTVLDLKKLIAQEIKVGFDEFVVVKHITDTYKSDIRNEEEKLIDHSFYNSTKILVQRGKPARSGETLCKFILYDIVNETKTDLFEFSLITKIDLLEVKKQIVSHFTTLQTENKKQFSFNIPSDPERIRIRQVLGFRPSTVYPNNNLLKDIIQKYHNPPEVIIQILPENQIEDKVSDDHMVLMLRTFHPGKYELGNVIEITVHKDEKIIEIKSRIANIVGIPVEQLTMATADSFDIQNILRLPKLSWYPRPQEDKKDSHKHRHLTDILDPNKPLRSLMLDDGSILLCRDLSIQRKTLTPSDERKIMEDEEKKRMLKMRTIYNRKEDRLDIKIADVSIIDTPQKKT